MKVNKNTIVFVLVFLLVGAGFSVHYLSAVKNETVNLVKGILDGNTNSISEFTNGIDSLSTKKISYYETLLDIHSLQNNVIGNKIVKKEDSVVIKSDSNSLIEAREWFSDEEIRATSDRVESLYTVASEQNAKFLYIAAPSKSYVNAPPCNVTDYTISNYNRLVAELQSRNIPCLNLADKMEEEGLLNSNAYFLTDHHWKPETGFWATKTICEELQSLYAFHYNTTYTDWNNYTVKTYEDWFLGSYGKKAGRLFTFEGAEDITLITPNFETSFAEEQPFKGTSKSGTFEETLLAKEYIETKDCYNLIPYSTYGGGDFRLQIIKNHQNENGKKIVMLRDSFACVVSPFLALNAAEIHLIDTRDMIPSDPINVYEYIEQVKPDYVIALYQDANKAEKGSRYDYDG